MEGEVGDLRSQRDAGAEGERSADERGLHADATRERREEEIAAEESGAERQLDRADEVARPTRVAFEPFGDPRVEQPKGAHVQREHREEHDRGAAAAGRLGGGADIGVKAGVEAGSGVGSVVVSDARIGHGT